MAVLSLFPSIFYLSVKNFISSFLDYLKTSLNPIEISVVNDGG
jgi:hypothetical protein